MKRGFTLFLLTICFLTTTTLAYAVTVTVSNIPESVTDQEFEFDVLVSGAQTGTNYIRASFFSPGTTSYFGFTYNGSSFYNGSDYSQYLPLPISAEGSGSATVKAKIDPGSSSFKGSGDYSFKVRRYTSQSYNTSSSEVTVSINYAAETPTPTPTQAPTPTSTPTLTPTPTPTKTATPTNSPSKPTPTKAPAQSTISIPPSILGTSAAQPTESQTQPEEAQVAGFQFSNVLKVAGGLILILSGVLVFSLVAKNKFPKV